MSNAGSDLFTSIFGNPTQGLSLFSNNVFRRQNTEHSDVLCSPTMAPPTVSPKHGFSVGDSKAARKEGMKSKEKKRDSSEPLSDGIDAHRQGSFLSGKKRNRWDGASPAEKVSSKKADSRQKEDRIDSDRCDQASAAEKASSKKAGSAMKGEQMHPKEQVKKIAKQKEEQMYTKAQVKKIAEPANSKTHDKLAKRAFQAVSEKEKPPKRQKLSLSTGLNGVADMENGGNHEHVSQKENTSLKRKKEDSSPNVKTGRKRSRIEVSLEERYEKTVSNRNSDLTEIEESRPMSALQAGEKLKEKGTDTSSGKRKRTDGDEPTVKAPTKQVFDTEEKLRRTIFVGNLPLGLKKKSLIREFSIYGTVESVRLRSVPLLDTKIPRRGAIIKGQINEAINSQHAYVVFSSTAHANAALAHNMKELSGNHLRVDAAYAPHQSLKGKSSLLYDPKRSIFVGNIPFDVKDEELYQIFSTGKSPELNVEAVRVVRDPQTSVSKGIAYVLFKSKAGASFFLSKRRNTKLRERVLRIHRVLASSQSTHELHSPSRHTKTREDVGNSLPQKKRAKLSASYEGIRASKENPHLSKDRRSIFGNQHRIYRSPKVKGHGAVAQPVGAKRKRMEKHQRGISRSKKLRRT